MQLALIPPRGWERWALKSHLHLALAQVNNSYYDQAYKEASDRGDQIIVDNGAAEGEPVGDYKLYYQADHWKANEVVLPDVMRDGWETIQRAKQFERNIKNSAYVLDRFDYMAVAQGKTSMEVRECIRGLAELPFVRTIGIPRHLISTTKHRFIRLATAEFIQREYPARFQIHFLGTNPSVPSEVWRAAREVPFVRSVDTSMPFNYAIAGIPLSFNAPAIGRPVSYLTSHQHLSTVMVKLNVDTMKRWAAGNE